MTNPFSNPCSTLVRLLGAGGLEILKKMPRLILCIAILIAAACTHTGCLIETETAIKPDPKVDPRLAGVWQIAEKLPHEIRGERDEDDIGVNGYIILAPLENNDGSIDESTLMGIAVDRFGRNAESQFPDMYVSTRKHKGRNLMLICLADYEKEKANQGGKAFKNWVIDYEFNKKGELFLRFWYIDDFEEMQKAHPMKSERSKQPFSPITLKGDEKALLDFYTDPKIRAQLTSMGKYQRLTPSKPNGSQQKEADKAAESKPKTE